MNRRGTPGVVLALLIVVVFGCGFALMALEMLGARLLSPFFGSSIHVWGSVISIFLLALSVGYWVGGLLSVWRPSGRVLSVSIALSAVGFAVIPLVVERVNNAVFDLDVEDRWGALLSATILFLVPSLLLGIVSPFSVRLATWDVGRAGASAGLLYSVSTLGSFLGCILTAFYFVLWLEVSKILMYMAGLLAAMAVLSWFIPRPRAAER
ncbi:MAG: fused MFS/spermidine synthase [Phycisphaerae bacterium]|nr:fused MFS/spermidine synthase [Phycisphaerae bacterium]